MLKAGFYEKEITPPLGSDMPGSFAHRYSKMVGDRLYAKSICMSYDDNTVIIISLDAISATTMTCDNVIKRITEYTGVPAENIMIGASHSHTGPAMHRNRGEFDTADPSYFDVEERLIADTAILAYQRMQPVTVKYNKSIEKGLTFNRNYIMKDGSIRTNPGWKNPDVVKPFGPADEDFLTLFFFDESGKPVGSIMNFACHNCCVTGMGSILSADYAGALTENMRREFGRDFVTVFLVGASGNLNHVDINREVAEYNPSRHIVMGELLGEAAKRHFKTAMPLEVDTLQSIKETITVKRIDLSDEEVAEAKELYETMSLEGLKYSINHPETKEYKRARASQVLYIARQPEDVPCVIQSIRLGEALIFAFCGEIYAEFGIDLKKRAPAKISMLSTLSNGSALCDGECYVPIPEAYGTTIYEAQKTSAFLKPEAGGTFVEKALEQADKLMKKER